MKDFPQILSRLREPEVSCACGNLIMFTFPILPYWLQGRNVEDRKSEGNSNLSPSVVVRSLVCFVAPNN